MLAPLAAWILAAHGLAWLVAALGVGGQEPLYCGTIFAGFLLAALAVQGVVPWPVASAGWLVAAIGNAWPFVTYGLPSSFPGFLQLLVPVALVGLAVAGLLDGRTGRWLALASAWLLVAGAAYYLLDWMGWNDWAWGNLLFVAGALALALAATLGDLRPARKTAPA